MFAIDELRQAGFEIWTESGKIRYKQLTERPVAEEWINSLLQNIKEHKQEAIRYLQGAAFCHAGKPELAPPAAPVPLASDGAELLFASIEYLAGITEPLTGWTIWKRIERGREYRFVRDAAGVIRWERYYALESAEKPRVLPEG